MITLINKLTVASFHVDAQAGFTPLFPNELPVPDGDNIVGELIEQDKLAFVRVGSKDAHPSNAKWRTDTPDLIAKPIPCNIEKNIDLFWSMHCASGTQGMELLKGLPKPEEYDYFVWKGIERNLHPYGACYHTLDNKLSTGVIEFLKSKNINTVIVGGLALDYCVSVTAHQLKDAGFTVIINLGACRGISPEGSNNAIKAFKDEGMIVVNSASEIIYE